MMMEYLMPICFRPVFSSRFAGFEVLSAHCGGCHTMVVARPLQKQAIDTEGSSSAESEAAAEDQLAESVNLEARIRHRQESSSATEQQQLSALPPISKVSSAASEPDAIEEAVEEEGELESDHAEEASSREGSPEQQQESNVTPDSVKSEGKISKFFKNLRPNKKTSEVGVVEAEESPDVVEEPKQESASFFDRFRAVKRDADMNDEGDAAPVVEEEEVKTSKTFLNRIGLGNNKKEPSESSAEQEVPNTESQQQHNGSAADPEPDPAALEGDSSEENKKSDKKEKKHVRINDDIESIHSNRQLNNRKSKLCTIL